MTYHPHVSVGGPPAVRELAHLVITKVAVGPLDNNAYLLRCRETDEQLLIDAANEADTLLRLTGDALSWVITTHRHADHWQALGEVVSTTGARTAAGRHDAEGIPVPTQELLDDGSELRFGAITLHAVHLVGHTAGSVALLYDDPLGHPHLFTGDCLFPGGVGRTTQPSEFASLFEGVRDKLFDTCSDETWVYPGHGNDTTLGAERPHLDEWRHRGW